METIQGIRGMPDVLPENTKAWQYFEQCWSRVVHAYGYEEIRLPLVESTHLFKRSIGEVTDIVEKEMFSFETNDGESLSLRPEGTAGCVRAGIEHHLLYHQVRRLWYSGPMFRYERPQKGRYRQFSQVGIEAFGLDGPDIDVEQITLTHRLWKLLRLQSAVTLQINSLGSPESRARYRETLVDYFSKQEKFLDEDSKRRLKTNPLRILDSKNPALQELILGAPKSHDYLDSESQAHFEAFQQGLSDQQIAFELNPQLVRGLDYYNRTVYEWCTDKLGAQGAVCAGGRYDGLVGQLGGSPTPGVGFALGVERVLLLQEALGGREQASLDCYVLHLGDKASSAAWRFSERLRDASSNLSVVVHCGGGSFKQQFKKADKSGAKVALIFGEEEVNANKVGIKFLREQRDQAVMAEVDAIAFLTDYIRGKINESN